MLCSAHTVVAMPPTVSFVEAATIPTVFLTAYNCLHEEASISAASRVLIHAATGGLQKYQGKEDTYMAFLLRQSCGHLA